MERFWPESEAAMVNKVRVNIAGAQYAFATTDSEKYITSLADKLDRDIAKLMEANPSLPVTKAAVFCAMDYLDEYQKSTGSAENMRSQIQDYIADAARARTAEDKLRAENEAGTGMYWVDSEYEDMNFRAIDPDQNFFFDENGDLVIAFDKYEVAPGAAGCPRFTIPQEIYEPYLAV